MNFEINVGKTWYKSSGAILFLPELSFSWINSVPYWSTGFTIGWLIWYISFDWYNIPDEV